MNSKNFMTSPEMMGFLSKHCTESENDASYTEKENDDDGLEELEDVFADHMVMEKRLRKRLYAGDFTDLKELPDHPPIALTGLALELFSKAVPNYGLDILDMDYVASASEAARISPCAMILAMIYLERLQLKNSDYLETASPSGLFVVTMLVASKFLFEADDDLVTNQMWAEALNLDVKDLNHLEYEFLSAIDWKVYIDSSDFFSYLSNVEKVVALKQSKCRGWFSFSDICVIAEHHVFYGFWSCLIKRIVKMTILSAFGYIVTAFALEGSGAYLQAYMKPTKCSVQNITEATQVLDSGHHNDMHLINQSAPIDDIISEPDSITLNIYIMNQDKHETSSDFETRRLCHPYSKYEEVLQPPIAINYALNNCLTVQSRYYSPYQDENLRVDALEETNYTLANVSCNHTSYYNGQHLCLFLKVKQCY